MKFLIIAFVLFIAYRLFFPPVANRSKISRRDEVDRGAQDDFIEYEEIEDDE